MSEKANELADVIDRLSGYSFVLAVDPHLALPSVINQLSASVEDFYRGVVPEPRGFRNAEGLNLEVSKMYRVMARRAKYLSDELTGYQNDEVYLVSEEKHRKAATRFRNILIKELAEVYQRLTGETITINQEVSDDPFSRLVKAVLLDMEITPLQGRTLSRILQPSPTP